jgi:hypothetical protein
MALEVSPFLNEKKLILVALASVNPLRAMCSKGTENRTLKRLRRLRDTFPTAGWGRILLLKGGRMNPLSTFSGTIRIWLLHQDLPKGESNPELNTRVSS